MIILATGRPSAKAEEDHVVVRLPSGKDDVQVALTLDQAFALEQLVRRASIALMDERRANATEATGEVIALPRELPSLVKRELRIAEIVRASCQIAS